MKKFNMQRSKDTLCDYFLVKLWDSWLDSKKYDVNIDFDLIDDQPEYVAEFMQYLEYITGIRATDLKQFGFKSVSDLQNYLKQAFHNLENSGIDF